LLVEGGTIIYDIIYDIDGLASATGDAKLLLDLAYGEVRRYLGSSSRSSSGSIRSG
jgi:hypothetical protein